MPQKPFNPILALVGVSLLALLAAGVWLGNHRPTPPATPTGPTSAVASTPTEPAANPALTDKLKATAKQLATATDAAGRNAALAAIKAALSSGSPHEASGAIRQFLDSKTDATTGLGFKVGKGGSLKEAPTLRTWLLDELGQIDPAAAAAYAKVILNSSDSPDEWAVALRNLALGDTSAEARSLLEQKTAALLGNQSWQQNPSTGYLEAFDVAVYLGGSQLTPALANLVQQQSNPAVAHASFLALDRLVINNPAATLSTLLSEPTSMQGRESTRADYFARADVRDPQQRQILENYLLNPQISPTELNAFAGIYPNANYMISDNLLTQNQTPDRAALTGRDTASLQALQQWLADPRFAQIRPNLQSAANRLAEFVQQENAQK